MTVQNIQGALRTYLLADTALAALIGTRIYSFPAPQKVTDPYVVIQRISKETIDNLNEFSNVLTDRFQLDVYSKTLDTSESTAKAIFDRLHMKNHFTMSGYYVYLIQFENENETVEPENNGSESRYYRISQDFSVKRSYLTL